MTDSAKIHVEEEKERIEEEREAEPARLTTEELAKSLKDRREGYARPQSEAVPLLDTDKAQDFRSQWDSIQTSFVDEPREAVSKADSLVAEVMQHLAQKFTDERQNLEGQWSRGSDVSTEDLRLALQRYRSFFSRLLSI